MRTHEPTPQAAGRRQKAKKPVKISGKIIKGIGESGSFLSIDWVTEGMNRCFSFRPFPGTLNIEVSKNIQKILRAAEGERLIAGQEGFCDALLFKGVIAASIPCGVVLPLVENYPADLIEIVAPMHLKEALGLTDGDGITIEIEI